jgi:hypothetical protein
MADRHGPGAVANRAAVCWDGLRARIGRGRVGLQGAPLPGRDRALGGPVVLPLRRKPSRSRADDGRSRPEFQTETLPFNGTRPRSRGGCAFSCSLIG